MTMNSAGSTFVVPRYDNADASVARRWRGWWSLAPTTDNKSKQRMATDDNE
jgi:hypothetical protein